MVQIWALVARYLSGEMNSMSEPRLRQFIDTNILIYAHDVSAGQKHNCAQRLIRYLWQSGEG